MEGKFKGGNGWLMFLTDAAVAYAVYIVVKLFLPESDAAAREIYVFIALAILVVLWKYILPIFITHGTYTADDNRLKIRCGPIFRSISYCDIESVSAELTKTRVVINHKTYFMCLFINLKSGRTLKYWDYTGYMNESESDRHHFSRLCEHINNCTGGGMA